MPVIARRLFLSVLPAAALCYAAAETTLDRLAKLSADLSDGNGSSALGSFDSSIKNYGDISAGIEALTAQAEIVCAIEVIEEKEEAGVHKLDTDWVLQLRSKGEHGPLERRRERLQLEMRQFKNKWKITSISAVTIFAPLRIR